jgi:hypothetical protein
MVVIHPGLGTNLKEPNILKRPSLAKVTHEMLESV